MSKRINMAAGPAVSGGVALGLMTSAGNPWTVDDGLAYDLVNRGVASFVDPEPQGSQSVMVIGAGQPDSPTSLTLAQIAGIKSGVSGGGITQVAADLRYAPIAPASVAAPAYNGNGQLTGYTAGGVAYTLAYPDSTHIVKTGGGVTTTITLDGSGNFVSKVSA